jgi:hypothetical protein
MCFPSVVDRKMHLHLRFEYLCTGLLGFERA